MATAPPTKQAVQAFFAIYDPGQCGNASALAAKYQGQESALFQKLGQKYATEYWTVRGQVIELLQKHEPTKVQQVDALLQKHPKREAELLATLCKKLGVPVPAAAAAPAAAAPAAAAPGAKGAGHSGDWRGRLSRFYQKYDPPKVATVDRLLEKYAGKEEQLMDTLVRKYGPEPGGPNAPALPPAARIWRLFYRKMPDKLPNVAGLLEKKKGAEAETLAALQQKYGKETDPAGPPPEEDLQLRVINMYCHYCPAQLSALPKILEERQGKEAALLKQLVRKHGPEPTAPPRPWRERIEAMYKRYNPEKLSAVDAAMQKYRGKEGDLLAAMVAKYGPEPPPPGGLGDADRVLLLLSRHAPGRLAEAEQLLRDHAGKEEELIASLEQRHGPEPDPEEEPPEGSHPRATQVYTDMRSWAELPAELHSEHSAERAARWAEEDGEVAARAALVQEHSTALGVAQNAERLRLVAEGCLLRSLHMAYSRWLAWLKQRIAYVRMAHMIMCDERMTVYDQLQSNRWSAAWARQIDKWKSKTQRHAAARPPAAAPASSCPPPPRPASLRRPPADGSGAATTPRRADPAAAAPAGLRSLLARSPPGSVTVQRRPLTGRSQKRAPAAVLPSPLSATCSPAARAALERYQRKWAPPQPPPEQPARMPSALRRPPTGMPSQRQPSPAYRQASPPPVPDIRACGSPSGAGSLHAEGQTGWADYQRHLLEAAEHQAELDFQPDGDLFARALQVSSGTAETAVERALREARPRQTAHAAPAAERAASPAARRAAELRARRIRSAAAPEKTPPVTQHAPAAAPPPHSANCPSPPPSPPSDPAVTPRAAGR
eukprot:TRINITY_DN994_c0_g1_i1.p1 TRINITY_DN994_c0_g1~~TRINITY_DN994_c0_g1_i1.p1  ORF type:complete len:858 (+),score=188.18 TRINITY_DN994_c0_g1_i1:82-2574(+)